VYFSDYSTADPFDDAIYDESQEIYINYLTSEECGGNWTQGTTPEKLGYLWETEEYASDPNSQRYNADPKPNRRYLVPDPSKPGETIPVTCAYGIWGGTYTFDGPVHSNDTFWGFGAKMNGKFSTSDPLCKDRVESDQSTWNLCAGGKGLKYDHKNAFGDWGHYSIDAYFDWSATPEAPRYEPVMTMPGVGDANSMSQDGDVGCRYEGPTRIILEGTKMRVWSKETTTDRDNCGEPGGDLAGDTGALVDIPDDGLIYVAPASHVSPVQIPSGKIGGPTNATRLPLGDYEGTEGPGESYEYEAAMTEKNKLDGYGNVWVEGEMTGGLLTIAADRNIIITGDLITTYPDQDLIGLLGGEAVEIMNPDMRNYTGQESDGSVTWQQSTTYSFASGWPSDANNDGTDLTIHAAIYCAGGGFRVQNYDTPEDRGTIKVLGSVAEHFMAFQGSTVDNKHYGYELVMTYNETLRSSKPLLFPALGNGAWTLTWQEKSTTNPDLKDS
jgi:hypothetical protein